MGDMGYYLTVVTPASHSWWLTLFKESHLTHMYGALFFNMRKVNATKIKAHFKGATSSSQQKKTVSPM